MPRTNQAHAETNDWSDSARAITPDGSSRRCKPETAEKSIIGQRRAGDSQFLCNAIQAVLRGEKGQPARSGDSQRFRRWGQRVRRQGDSNDRGRQVPLLSSCNLCRRHLARRDGCVQSGAHTTPGVDPVHLSRWALPALLGSSFLRPQQWLLRVGVGWRMQCHHRLALVGGLQCHEAPHLEDKPNQSG
jgi:hypothetical protein